MIEPLWTELLKGLEEEEEKKQVFLLTKDGWHWEAGSWVTMRCSCWPHWRAVGARGLLTCHSSRVTRLPHVKSWKMQLFGVGEVGCVTGSPVLSVLRWPQQRKKISVQAGNWVSKLTLRQWAEFTHWLWTNQSKFVSRTMKHTEEHLVTSSDFCC